jgi:hypothetical protein
MICKSVSQPPICFTLFLDFLPTIRALKLEGGMLHIHANVRAGEQQQWANEMIEKLRALACELPEPEKRQFEVWVGVRDVHRTLLKVFAC